MPVMTVAMAYFIEKQVPTSSVVASLVVLSTGVGICVWQGQATGTMLSIILCTLSTLVRRACALCAPARACACCKAQGACSRQRSSAAQSTCKASQLLRRSQSAAFFLSWLWCAASWRCGPGLCVGALTGLPSCRTSLQPHCKRLHCGPSRCTACACGSVICLASWQSASALSTRPVCAGKRGVPVNERQAADRED